MQELVELLLKNNFDQFKNRYQSFLDQIPKSSGASAAPAREGFFQGYFLGMFGSLLNTQLSTHLGIKNVYYKFDSSQNLHVVVEDDKQKRVFVFSKDGQVDEYKKQYKDQANIVNITCGQGGKLEVSISSGDNIIVSVSESDLNGFNKVSKAKLNSSLEDIVHSITAGKEGVANKEQAILDAVQDFLKYAKDLYSQGSFGDFTNVESFQHGFLTGILMNNRYRENMKAYVEIISGRGYADIILLIRGEGRSFSAIPIIVELKKRGIKTAKDALDEAVWYAKGLRLNKMRMLTSSQRVVCVGLDINNSSDNVRDIYRTKIVSIENTHNVPLLQGLLTLVYNPTEDVEDEIKDLLGRVFYLFPSTQETYNHLSRSLMGQLPLIDKIKENKINSYVGYESSKFLTVFVFCIGNQLLTFNISEKGRNHEFNRLSNKQIKEVLKLKLDNISKITEINIVGYSHSQQDVKEGSPSPGKWYRSGTGKVDVKVFKREVKRYSDYFAGGPDNVKLFIPQKERRSSVEGAFKDAIMYQHDRLKQQVEELRLTVTNSGGKCSIGQYMQLFEEVQLIMEDVTPFISKEHEFKAVLDGLLTGLSDLKLFQPNKDINVIVVPEFQVGSSVRVDLAIQTIEKKGSGFDNGVLLFLELKVIDLGPREVLKINKLSIQDKKTYLMDKAQSHMPQLLRYLESKNLKALTDRNEVAGCVLCLFKDSNGKYFDLCFPNTFTLNNVVHSSLEVVPMPDPLPRPTGSLESSPGNQPSTSVPGTGLASGMAGLDINKGRGSRR